MPDWTGLIRPWPFVLGQELAGIFAIREWSTLDGNGVIRFRGRFLVDPETAMSLLVPRLNPYGYVPMLQSQEEITLLRRPAIRPELTSARKGWVLNLVLFLATLLTTLFIGAMMEGAQPLTDPKAFLLGVPFSASLLLILGFHELGHYLTARAYGVQVSLPYFVPLPLPPMGTMGAIIRMRSPIPNRKVLFDIGIAGPLAGLILALPVLAIGLMFSPVKPQSGLVLQEGNSLIYLALKWIVKGPIPEGSDVFLHPMALAGWLGLFVTALNLMPLSQLDGGHIAYAALGRTHHKIVWLFLGALVLLYFIARWEGWLVWVALAVGLGLRHPPPLDDLTPLDPLRRILAIAALVLLLTLITPLPFAVYEF
jgi:membrane-associated protease RseP (regulator of RpoE activity)